MKILVVDEMHESLLPLLNELGAEVSYQPTMGKVEAEQIIHQYEGLLIRSKFFIDAAFLDLASSLKFIGRAGAGLDLIDLQACRERSIAVFAANEANKVAVAEHLLGMILMLFNKLNTSPQEIRNDQWLREKNRGEELMGKTVGLVGYGHNGSTAASRFAAFGCRVLAYDKYKQGFGSEEVEEVGIETIFQEADVFSFHVPLTEETRKWADTEFFSKFKKPIYFCNVARGEIMVQEALIQALEAGKVKGACLDVMENEKLSALTEKGRKEFEYLRAHPRVILSPHVAGWTIESYRKINEVLCEKIKAFYKL
jgi:D-3-phosphoglycerate dehydrogenase